MPHAPNTELPDLIDWLTNTIEPLQGEHWQVTLDSNGSTVKATAKIVQSKKDDGRGNTMTITRVTEVRFRLGRTSQRRTVLRTE